MMPRVKVVKEKTSPLRRSAKEPSGKSHPGSDSVRGFAEWDKSPAGSLQAYSGVIFGGMKLNKRGNRLAVEGSGFGLGLVEVVFQSLTTPRCSAAAVGPAVPSGFAASASPDAPAAPAVSERLLIFQVPGRPLLGPEPDPRGHFLSVYFFSTCYFHHEPA